MRRICAAAVVAGMTILLTLSAWKNHTYPSKTEVEPEYVFSYAENQPEDYPTTLGAKYFAELVEERTKWQNPDSGAAGRGARVRE